MVTFLTGRQSIQYAVPPKVDKKKVTQVCLNDTLINLLLLLDRQFKVYWDDSRKEAGPIVQWDTKGDNIIAG